MSSCDWGFAFEAMRVYHDTEWGVPVHDDRRMFEHLMMEAMQCGLSWDLMLKKRDIFRQCFDHFEYDRIAAYTEDDVQRIMNTEGMLKSERKILAVINTLFVVLGTIGVVNDPTTFGLNDSDRAMQYSEPVKREISDEQEARR